MTAPGVTLTPEAAAKAARLLARDGRAGAFVRFGVKGGGCSGFEYVFMVDDRPRATDSVYTFGDVTVRVDFKSGPLVEGTVISASRNLVGSGFDFENPNVQRSCGCGTSFTPKAR